MRGGGYKWDGAGVADPYVIKLNGKLYMYYLGQNNMGIQRLGVAVSEDGMHWIKYANNPIMDVGSKGSFDENGLGEPSVIYHAPYFYMIYTGRNTAEQRNIGAAVSLDGVTWKKLNYHGMVNLDNNNTWNNQVICDTTLVNGGNGNVIAWYGGGNMPSPDQNLNGKIGMFTIAFDGIADAARFDPNVDDEVFVENSADFLRGSHEIEGEQPDRFAWCTDNVSITLRDETAANNLYIRGYIPLDLHHDAGREVVRLSFYMNGKKIGEKTFDESGVFEVELPKAGIMADRDYILLEIKASSYVIPKDCSASDDERVLSWIVNEISQR